MPEYTGFPRCTNGIVAVFGSSNLRKDVYTGLMTLSQRGRFSSGVAIIGNDNLGEYRKSGTLNETDLMEMEKIRDHAGKTAKGDTGIGQVSYEENTLPNKFGPIHPYCLNHMGCDIAIAFDGFLVHEQQIKKNLDKDGAVWKYGLTPEIVINSISRSKHSKTMEDAVLSSIGELDGGYSMIIGDNHRTIGVKDSLGHRPLCVGKRGNTYFLASETCALDTLRAKFLKELEPGEAVVIDRDGAPRYYKISKKKGMKLCSLEFINTARGDSIIFGQRVDDVKRRFGRELAKELYVEADIAVPVPFSGYPAVLGWADETKMKIENAIIKNTEKGDPIASLRISRKERVERDYNVIGEYVEGKTIVLIDSAFTTGSTIEVLCEKLWEAGAKKIHVRIPSRILGNDDCGFVPNYLGDKPLKNIEADSIDFLSKETLLRCITEGSRLLSKNDICTKSLSD
jgi:amidophosphoribosyltransferase